ncbi:MAG: hypothetical protein ACK5AZ_12015 [Bryobacteraceae bacterium]
MELDAVTVVLLVLLGASLANALDTAFRITPRLADWLVRLFDPLR